MRPCLQALFYLDRMRLDLLPYYSRMVATLHPGMPDIGDELVRCQSLSLFEFPTLP